MRCEEDGCKECATHSVTLNVPAAGVPIDLHQPLRLYIDVKLCHEHAKEFGRSFTWEENEELRDNIAAFVREAKFGARDFDRTFASSIRLEDPGFKEIQKFIEKYG
jgi:hypothetical protein